ncbi:uncharacterized protein F21D5.5 isoform X2 [Phymastichus coffea]|uniref:uncharacterized protein F21D5.5 isoform X2 n=1 Tax=Phymastichus coffea TaxID=108790 RepID=UPI00273C9C80|nr:uncharacterized protein F21D5.5 isoform X2 [Phymastichus coffea]
MNAQTTSCYIYSDDKSMPPVFLPDRQPVFVGRNVDTKITDPHCSRKQVRLCASYKDHKVFVEQLGSRASGLNGYKTEKGVKVVAQHGDRLEILYGRHPYQIEFNPPPLANIKREGTAKRLVSQESEDEDDNEPQRSKKFKLTSTAMGTEEDQLFSGQQTSTEHSSSDTNNEPGSPSEYGEWEYFDNKTLYVYTSNGCQGRSKIAAYDMDKTLIKTISGLQFPKDCNDWQLLYPDVPAKIKEFYKDGYKIVIMSNQASLGTGKIRVKDFKLKIERLVKKIGVPMQVYLAVGESIYRKPRTGMWQFLVDKKNDGIQVDKENSFYVGDAAGRPANASRKKKDHSLADRLLALNLGLNFQTPEEHFLGQKEASYNAPAFDPKEASKNTVLCEPSQTKLTSDEQELILMVGCPGSGKSHFAKTHLRNYCYVNRDTLGNWQKCVSKTDEALSQGKSVVVDNTNPDKTTRQRYIEIAKKRGVPVRCFAMALDKEHVRHNNMFRILTDPTHQAISDMIINSYIKNFKPPSEDEGFSEIVKIKFVPFFKSDEDRRLYEMYLLG